MHDLLKKKICKENNSKNNQNALNMLEACLLGEMGVIRCTLKVIVTIKQL